MAKTVAAAAIGITADLSLARKEISQLGKILRETADPVEKLERDVALLEKIIASSTEVDSKHVRALRIKTDQLQKLRLAIADQAAAEKLGLDAKTAAIVATERHNRSLIMSAAEMSGFAGVLQRLASSRAFVAVSDGIGAMASKLNAGSIAMAEFAMKSKLVSSALGSVGVTSTGLARVGLAAIPAVAAAAYAGVNKLTAGVLDQVDQQDDLAKTLGVSYNALKQFEFALSLAGGVSEGQAVDGLRSLSRMVGEASLGMGKGRKIFEELGLDVGKLASMDAVKQFDEVSKAIASIEQPAARAAIAVKVFGDERIALAVGKMAGELDKAKKSAQEFQPLLSESQIQNAKELNDQMQIFGAIWGGIKLGVFGRLAGLLVETNNGIIRLTKSVSEFGTSWANYFGIKTASQIAAMQEEVNAMNAQAEAFGQRVLQQQQAEIEGSQEQLRIAQEQSKAQQEHRDAQKEVFERQQASLQFRKDELNYGKRLAEINKAVREGMSDKQATQFVDDMLALEEREKKQKALVDQQAKQQQAMKDFEAVRRDAAMQSASEFDRVASQVRAFRTQFEGLIGGDELAQVALEKFGPAMRAALTGSIPQIQAPSLVRAGSAEAYRMTIQPQIDRMQQQIDLQSQQLAEQQASNAILQEMSSNIANIQPAQRRR